MTSGQMKEAMQAMLSETLLDVYAGNALTGLLASNPDMHRNPDNAAMWAYSIAAAMVRARNEQIKARG